VPLGIVTELSFHNWEWGKRVSKQEQSKAQSGQLTVASAISADVGFPGIETRHEGFSHDISKSKSKG